MIIALLLPSIVALSARADIGASHAIQLHAVPGATLSIQMGDGFLDASKLAANDPYRAFFGRQPNGDQRIYHGRAVYEVPIAPAKLSEAFFENINEFQKLVGKHTKLTLITQKPFVFRSSLSVALGLVHVESTARMLVRDYAQLKPGLVDGLLRGKDKPLRVLIQETTDFNMYFDRAFMISLLYPGQHGGTRVEVVSAVVINDLPPFGGEDSVSKMSRQNLIDYATRLSQERP